MAKVLDALNGALHHCMTTDERVVVLGEDILDPYGGAFKVTKGLSIAYGDRVRTTPVSESAIVGAATGMALRGLRPVAEIMFGDFTTLIADQLINHAAKFATMYGTAVEVPLVVRTPMGGRRGYGPTHSQTLEKLYCGVPGLRVLAPAALGDPGALLTAAILEDSGPVLFVENKILYNTEVLAAGGDGDVACTSVAGRGYAPAHVLTVRHGAAPSLTIASYGYAAELARQALVRLAYEFEIFAELVVVGQLAPCDLSPVAASLRSTGRLLTVEEGSRTLGWGTEIVARSFEDLGPSLRAARRVAMDDVVLPAAAPLELAVLPSVDDIVKAAVEVGTAA